MPALLIPILFAVIMNNAAAETLTAKCADIKGRVVGIHGITLGKKPLDESDAITGARLAITWDNQTDTARILSEGAVGRPPIRETGKLVHVTRESVSFIVTYLSAIWLYTLFVVPEYLLLTQHSNGFGPDTGGAVTKAFYARCNVAVSP